MKLLQCSLIEVHYTAGDAVAIRVELQTSDRKVAGSTLALALLAQQP